MDTNWYDGGDPDYSNCLMFYGAPEIELINGAVSANSIVMVSKYNNVQFLSDIDITAYTEDTIIPGDSDRNRVAFGILPNVACPPHGIHLPCICELTDETIEVSYIYIRPNGIMSVRNDAAIICLSGLNFNISGNWYVLSTNAIEAEFEAWQKENSETTDTTETTESESE